MAEVTALGVKVTGDGITGVAADLDKLAASAANADSAATRLGDGSKKTGDAVKQEGDAARKAAGDNERLAQGAKTADGSLARLGGTIGTVIGRLAALAATALSIGAFARMADSWSDLRSQLGAAIGDMDAANGMMQRMVDIANASYSPLDQTVQIFARNVSVLRDLGVSAQGAADFTESLNHMLVITATRGERAASVQNALSKAMAVGRLQADGLETILANGGRVAEALAAELGINVSQLREFAAQGKITGDVIARAVIKPLEEVRRVAGDMDATLEDAFVRVGTNLTAFIGQMDQMLGVSGGVAQAIIVLADNIDMVAGFVVAAAGAVTAMFVPSLYAAVTATYAWVAALVTLKGAILATGIGALVIAAGYLIGKFFELVRATGSFGEALNLLGDVAVEAWGRIADGATVIELRMRSIMASINALWLNGLKTMIKGWKEFLDVVSGGMRAIPGMGGMADSLAASSIGIGSTIHSIGVEYEYATEAATAFGSQADAVWHNITNTSLESLAALRAAMDAAGPGGGTGTVTGGAARATATGGGGGGGQRQSALDQLINEFATERELLNAWHTEKLALILEFSDLELEALGGRHGAIERLEQEHQDRMAQIKKMETEASLSMTIGAGQEILSAMGAFNQKALKAAQVFGAAQALISTYQGAAEALKLPFPKNLAAAAAVMAKGLSFVAAIKGVNSSGGGGSGGGGGGSTSTTAAAAPLEPQTIRIAGVNPDTLLTGQMMQDIFDAVYKENSNRGVVFQVAKA